MCRPCTCSASLSQYSFFYGLKFTTATFAITFANMAPVLTFLIAIALRYVYAQLSVALDFETPAVN